MNSQPKVTSERLKRRAYLYVRQSTLRHVLENTESSKRQYALRQRPALRLLSPWSSRPEIFPASGISMTIRDSYFLLGKSYGDGGYMGFERGGVVPVHRLHKFQFIILERPLNRLESAPQHCNFGHGKWRDLSGPVKQAWLPKIIKK